MIIRAQLSTRDREDDTPEGQAAINFFVLNRKD